MALVVSGFEIPVGLIITAANRAVDVVQSLAALIYRLLSNNEQIVAGLKKLNSLILTWSHIHHKLNALSVQVTDRRKSEEISNAITKAQVAVQKLQRERVGWVKAANRRGLENPQGEIIQELIDDILGPIIRNLKFQNTYPAIQMAMSLAEID